MLRSPLRARAEILPAASPTISGDAVHAMAAGEVVWAGVEPGRAGRTPSTHDHAIRLRAPAAPPSPRYGGQPGAHQPPARRDVLSICGRTGVVLCLIHHCTGRRLSQETVDALWDLVGPCTSARHAHRSRFRAAEQKKTHRRPRTQPFRSRRLMPRTAEGRWSVLETRKASRAAMTEWSAALAQQLLTRHGVVTRETVAAEAVAGGFSAVYDVLKAMEEAGRIRRGYFVGGLGGAQFAVPPAVDMLRSFRDVPEEPRHVVLAATDPANPYGSAVKWAADQHGPTRSVGARVILVDGFAAGYLRRSERELLLFTPDAEPQRSRLMREVADALLELAAAREPGRQGMLIAEINGTPAATHPAPVRVRRIHSTAWGCMRAQAAFPRMASHCGSPDGGIPMANTRAHARFEANRPERARRRPILDDSDHAATRGSRNRNTTAATTSRCGRTNVDTRSRRCRPRQRASYAKRDESIEKCRAVPPKSHSSAADPLHRCLSDTIHRAARTRIVRWRPRGAPFGSAFLPHPVALTPFAPGQLSGRGGGKHLLMWFPDAHRSFSECGPAHAASSKWCCPQFVRRSAGSAEAEAQRRRNRCAAHSIRMAVVHIYRPHERWHVV